MKRFLGMALAATFLSPLAVHAETPTDKRKPKVEVVFVLDTTGSMNGLIDGAKRKIWSIANSIADQNPDAEIRMGLIGYRDIGDEYVTKSFELTTDIQGLYGKLLAFQADGGGDTPESVNEALDVAVLRQGWTAASPETKANRIIFLVGDAPPHMDYKQDRKYPEIIQDARQRGIIVNTVQAGKMRETTRVWKAIADLGGGEYMAIPQDGGRIIVIETPYDDEILTIQASLNATVLPYGKAESQRVVKDKMARYAAAPKSSAAEMSKFVHAKGKGKEVVTGGGDLVTDVNNGARVLAEVPAAELPDAMQKMTPAERETFVAEQARKRDDLARQLADKVKLRDNYVKEQEAAKVAGGSAEADSFDQAVSKTLRKQIK